MIDPFWFLISFCLGILYVYCLYKTPDVYIKYPTPEDAEHTVFKDDTDNCYRFKTKEVDCPKNPLSIHTIPVQRKVEYFGDAHPPSPALAATHEEIFHDVHQPRIDMTAHTTSVPNVSTYPFDR